jgi:SAM-dependent methyltransferase
VAEWWQDFFEGRWETVQLGQSDDVDANRAAAEKIERLLGLAPGSDVLDVPCGDGRISHELADLGYVVTGVDASGRFIGEARRKAGERGTSSRFEEGDMRELRFESKFDAVINFGGSFGYFDDDGNERVAASAYRALRPGGRYLIDAITPETIFRDFRDRHWFEVRDSLVVAENSYDAVRGRVEGHWTIVDPDGTRSSQHSSMRVYTFVELRAVALGVGFDRVDGLDSDELTPFHLGSSRLLLVATKGRSIHSGG